MLVSLFIALLLLVTTLGFQWGKQRILRLVSTGSRLPSLPSFYGASVVTWVVPVFLILLVGWYAVPQPVRDSVPSMLPPALIATLTLLITAVGVYSFIRPSFHARYYVERVVKWLLLLAALFSITITAMIMLSMLVEAGRFFDKIPFTNFLFGLEWSPQTAMREEQAGSSGSFGAVPVFAGTLLVMGGAMVVALPLGILSAIYLAEFASRRARTILKPFLEILAGVPSVVYGYFAAVTIAPIVRDFGVRFGLDVSSESALVAGAVIGVMIIPLVLSLSDDVMNAVPNSLRDASLALGATEAETVKKVVLPAALPGIMGAVLLAVSRGIGETMVVVMAAGLAANLTLNPFSSVTTVTAQIVTLLVGDQEFDSAKTLAAFALGLTLFVVTLALNIISLTIVKKYKEQYE